MISPFLKDPVVPPAPSNHRTGKLPCPALGEGWFFERVRRLAGASAGGTDTYYTA